MIAPGVAELRHDAGARPGLDTADVRCLLIDSAWDFTALRPEWNSMLRDSAASSPFLTWEWLHTWWTHLGGSSQLRMLAVRSGSELVAVAPFRTAAGTAHLPCLDMLGTGEAGSDYLDVIVRRGWEAVALDAIERFARSHNTALRLTHLGPSAAAAGCISPAPWRIPKTPAPSLIWRTVRARRGLPPPCRNRHQWRPTNPASQSARPLHEHRESIRVRRVAAFPGFPGAARRC